jgi:aminomethyltransferase
LFGDGVDLELHHWREQPLERVKVYVHRTDAVAGDGYFVMCDSEDAGAVWQQLLGANITPAEADAFDYLRIESGLPRFGHEITEDYIPLEAGLWRDVSFSKGCYIGQEIIARMESRGRLAKQLVRLQADAPVPVAVDVQARGRAAGRITSAGDGPAGPLALGYVKSRALGEAQETELSADAVGLTIVETVRR